MPAISVRPRVKVVSIFLLSFLPCVLCQTVVTTVPDTSNEDAYVAAVLGEGNVTLECVLFVNGNPFIPNWYIQRQSIDSGVVQITHNNGVPISPTNLMNLRLSGDLSTILTITNFTDQFDMSIIQCGRQALDLRKTFNLGFPCTLKYYTNLHVSEQNYIIMLCVCLSLFLSFFFSLSLSPLFSLSLSLSLSLSPCSVPSIS